MTQTSMADAAGKAPGSRLRAAAEAVGREWKKLQKQFDPIEFLGINVMAGAPIGCAAAYFMTPQGSGLLGPLAAAGLTFLTGTAVMMGFNKLDEPDKKPAERRDDGFRPSAQAMQDASPDMEKLRAKIFAEPVDLPEAMRTETEEVCLAAVRMAGSPMLNVSEQLDAEKISAKIFAGPVDLPEAMRTEEVCLAAVRMAGSPMLNVPEQLDAAAPAQDEGEAMAALFNAAASKQRDGGNGPAPAC